MATNFGKTDMVSAIIVAAGQGTRMQGQKRKQYLSLGGIPILTRTLAVFARCDRIKQIILVIPQGDFDFCQKHIVEPAGLTRKIMKVPGGAHRQESVFSGLKKVNPDCSIVVIHDGVRPFVQHEQLIECIDGARETGACIMGLPACETLKEVDASDHIIQTLKRDGVWLADASGLSS